MTDEFPVLQFHHIQFYVDSLLPTTEYKQLEQKMTKFTNNFFSKKLNLEEGKKEFETVSGGAGQTEYSSLGRDLCSQLICSVGLRVTQKHEGKSTHSVLLSAQGEDSSLRFVLTAGKDGRETKRAKGSNGASVVPGDSDFEHFELRNLERFFDSQSGRQGVGVLAFGVSGGGGVEKILKKYQEKHPDLCAYGGIRSYNEVKILEVAAYYGYKKGTEERTGKPDAGTILRFVEIDSSATPTCSGILPGMTPVEAVWDHTAPKIFSDHWVSNVVNRKEFLSTLEDTLGFTPKVDFNAGVVAAGEAIIESTVTGNTGSPKSTHQEALTDVTQVFLPINNAMSDKGHVFLYLEEIGQGIQHIASRVEQLCPLIQRANDVRKMTGEGFTFLNIPRSYYGRLTEKDFISAGIPESLPRALLPELVAAGHVTKTGIVRLDLEGSHVTSVGEKLTGDAAAAFKEHKDKIVQVVSRGRYVNLYKFLGDHLDEAAYMQIVNNKVLVDIQGNDVLYQIFTSCVLQRNAGEEAPFLEFIQRVCSQQKDANGNPKPIRAGCGGFGIRNFLTLFLSIEVSKAMGELEKAEAAADGKSVEYFKKVVDAFTEQLDESNPILTAISEAMTDEGDGLEELERAKNDEEKAKANKKIQEAEQRKKAGNVALQECSTKYKNLMKKLREDRG